MSRLRLLLPVVVFALLLLVVAAIGAGAAPAASHKAPSAPTPAPAPAEPQHTTLDFEHQSADSLASDEDDASSAGSAYWTKAGAGSGDLVRFGQPITVPAGRRVLGDVVAMGGDIDVYGSVTGDAVAVGGGVHVHPGGEVRKETISIGGHVVNDAAQGLHGSSVSLPGIPAWLFNFNMMNVIGQGLAVVKIIFSLLLFAAFAWAVNALASERTERAVGYIRTSPGPAFLWGLGTFIGIAPSAVAVVLFSILLIITLIGIPVAILLLASYVVALILLVIWGSLVGAAVVGRWAWHRMRPFEPEPPLLKAMLAGIVALAVPNIIGHLLRSLVVMAPIGGGLGISLCVLGFVLSFVFWLIGIGALIATRGGMPPRLVTGSPVTSMPPVAPAPPASSAPPTPPAPPAVEPPPPATA